MEHEQKPRRANEIGPSGRRAAANLESIREERRMSQDELAAAVGRLGRPLTRQMIGKTEAGDRRIDVDDLVALAVALGTTPNRIVLTASAGEGEVELLPRLSARELDAWKWATGEEPIGATEQDLRSGARVSEFLAENRPQATPDGFFGRMFVYGDLVDAVDALARLAHEHGVPLAEVKHFLDFIYMRAVADQAPGSTES